jgi:uncharacterized protein
MAVASATMPLAAERALRPVVLVTGGSSGIGLALAHGFAARGHDIVLVARDTERLQRVAAAIAAAHGVSAGHFSYDLAEPEAVADLMASIAAARCCVDILVNCAGVATSGTFTDNDPADVRTELHLNIDAATSLMRACLPGMVARGRGGILNVASLAGMLPMPYLALYSATKSYLVSLSRAVAWEVKGTGVRVSVLLPGPVDTGFFAHNMHADAERMGLLPGLSPGAVARTAIDGFLAHQTVITPGMLSWLCRLGLKLLPQRMLVALVRPILRGALAAEAGDGTHPPSRASHERSASSAASTLPRGLRRVLGAPGHVLVLACMTAVFAVYIGLASRKAPHVDPGPRSTIVAAASLLEHGVFADTFVPREAGTAVPGRYLPPGYPAFVAGVAMLDRGLAATIRCLAAGRADCVHRNPFRALIALQGLLVLIALALVCRVALELSGSGEIAGLATLLTFMMGRFGELAVGVTPYAIVPPLALIFCALTFIAHRRRSLLIAAAAGLLLGFLALVEVYYAAIIALAPLLLLWAESSRAKPQRKFALGAAASLAGAASLVLGPWMARNYAQFGDIAPAQGSVIRHLAERMVYTGLSARELAVGLFFWLPGIGDFSSLFLPPETARKFDVYYKGSLLLDSGRILEATSVPAGESQFRRLLDVYALGRPGEYAAMTALLMVRGLRSTGGFLVLWGWLSLPLLVRRLRARRELGPFLLIAGPLWALTAVQSLLTADLPWMNAPLVFVYAYAIASVTGGLELPFGLRRLFSGRGSAGERVQSSAYRPVPPDLG